MPFHPFSYIVRVKPVVLSNLKKGYTRGVEPVLHDTGFNLQEVCNVFNSPQFRNSAFHLVAKSSLAIIGYQDTPLSVAAELASLPSSDASECAGSVVACFSDSRNEV